MAQFSFHLFAVDNNEGGCLTPSLLGSFLGSFATVLCACTEEGMEMKPEVLRSVIAAASNTAVSSMMCEFSPSSISVGCFDSVRSVRLGRR